MKIHEDVAILNEILESWRDELDEDFLAYRNHCYRVLNYCLVFSDYHEDSLNKVSIAVAHHDLGIWVDQTFDYLKPSKVLAREYLSNTNQNYWRAEIETMIDQHHKIRRYKANTEWLVESFRKADWVDVSQNSLKFGLPSNYIAEVKRAFPNTGFTSDLLL